MIKSITIICLLFFFSGSLVFCQNTEKKEGNFFPLYLDFGLGYVPYIGGMADLGTGYRFNQDWALGIDLINFHPHSDCCQTYADGIGLQLRWTPGKHFIFKLEGGRVLKAKYGDDGSYDSVYDKSASNRIYFRTSIGFRLLKIANIGLAYAQSGRQYNETRDYDTNELLDPVPFTVKSPFLYLGIALPGIKKNN